MCFAGTPQACYEQFCPTGNAVGGLSLTPNPPKSKRFSALPLADRMLQNLGKYNIERGDMRPFKHAVGMFTPLVRVATSNSPLFDDREFYGPNIHDSRYYWLNGETQAKWNDPDAIVKAKRGNVRGLALRKIS
ncbi:MAG: hypothetical protein QOD84_336 [Acidobacteriaceae bacterium]|jgi:hypothetical protein